MLEPVNLFELEVVVAPELGVASSHRVGGFQQIVAEITVAGLNQVCRICLKLTGLMLCPDKTSKLCNGGLGIKTMDIADLSEDTSGVDLADTGDGGQRTRRIEL